MGGLAEFMRTVVGILGVTHDPILQAQYHYPLALMEELIQEFSPQVICGEVHPKSWSLYLEKGNGAGILGETQGEYSQLIFPLCQNRGIEFVPIDWFEEDLFQMGPFDGFDAATQTQLREDLAGWNCRQRLTWDRGPIPFNCPDYDVVTEEMYEWLHHVNPEVQTIQWNVRHCIMMARVKAALKANPGHRILCIHGADHNYWYHRTLKTQQDIDLIYPLR